ncbi:toxin-activating lysine-acyltransferase [Bradyrhizobium ontarionense]|uniref:RTX toxin-activating lysine-acyltransferase n=1 Tax=Bradyrhizobium ontarionense TaxID=2898149 RepID=A0ABY3R6Y9_9BRAD|nr:toxin-activating lysine-acyltransferase [Bradyrhizobium sp. A19]UFZ02670.1 toxin-activating lysine-acyltransferase [Bradyrhizobium sp. A19]
MLFGKKIASDEATASQAAGDPVRATPAAGTAAAGDTAAATAGANEALSPEDLKKRMIASKQMAAAFGEIVTLLMRSPGDKHQSLADLEWLVVPAVVRGQYALAEARSKDTGATVPVGAVLWALVSKEVDERLSDPSHPLRLKPDEWRSGDIPWIMHAAGDVKVLAGLVRSLPQAALRDRQPKMRVRGADGKISVGHLDIKKKTAVDTAASGPHRDLVDA